MARKLPLRRRASIRQIERPTGSGPASGHHGGVDMGRSRSRGATVALLALLALVMGGTAMGVTVTVAGGTTSSGNATEAGAPLRVPSAGGTYRPVTVVP